MSLEKRYFNISRSVWVRSFEEPTAIAAPTFGYGDLRDFSVQFLHQLDTGAVEILPDIVSAKIGLAVAATAVTSASAGTVSNNHFPFVLPVVDASGTTLATLMSGKTTPQALNAEFLIVSASGRNRYYTQVFVSPKVNDDAVADPAVTEPAITMSEAAGVFIPKNMPKNLRIYAVDEVTNETLEIAIRNRQFEFNVLGP